MKLEDQIKIKEEDQKKRGAFGKITDAIASEKTDAIRKKSQALKDKLQELIDKKNELLRLPCLKAETLEMAKEALLENKKLYFSKFLEEHLADCQTGNVDAPLSPRSLSLGWFGRDDFWKLAYGIITGEDLERAAKTLPEIGISETERSARIKTLDTEIAGLENQIGKELKNL